MDLAWIDADNPSERDLAGAVAVLEAARVVDSPDEPGTTRSQFLAELRHGFDGDPPVAALLRDGRRPVALLQVWLPQYDNRHAGLLDLVVDPPARRRGHGRRLLEVGLDRARAGGRTVVMLGGWESDASAGFATASGFEQGALEVYRRLDLAPDCAPAELAQPAELARASAYDLRRMPGAVPEDLLEDVVRLVAAINDRPFDELDIEDEVFTPERVRAFETAASERGVRLYRLVAVHRESGELAGNTQVGVDIERPWSADQYDTSVPAAHRGHGLGLVLKRSMLEWLREAEPQLRAIFTDNSSSNAHMVAVNEQLGFRALGRWVEWQRHL